VLLLAVGLQAQPFVEGGIAPLNSRLRTSVALSAGLRIRHVELTLPAVQEFGHNTSAGLSVGYRFPGSYVQGSDEDGWILHAGAAQVWHTDAALKSGEVSDGLQPVVGLKWCQESRIGKAVVTELRYHGGAIMFLFQIRL
jgi:hypothetical protein